MISLPTPTFDTPPEPLFTGSEPPVCDRTDKPGVEAFRAFVKHTLGEGGPDYGTDRDCSVQPPSDHWWHGAWDWHNLAANPDDAARVQALLDWLLANDGEMYRRAGLKYVIWNHNRIPDYKTGALTWVPYTGPIPHIDHVHFSFSRAGANAQTSLYPWLHSLGYGGGSVPPPLPRPVPGTAPGTVAPSSTGGTALALAAGFALGYAATQVVRWL